MRAEIRRVSQRTLGWLAHASALRRLREQAAEADTVEKSIDLAFSFDHLGVNIRPMQYREELREFAGLAKSKRPRVVVEIGPGHGGTLFILSRVASPDATLVSIDLPASALGMGHPAWMDRLFHQFPMTRQELHILRGSSHDRSTYESLGKVLGGRMIDLLFIDGDHSYEGVRKDLEMYSPLVSRKGLVAFHDILPHTRPPYLGVSRLWQELKVRGGNCLEIVGPRDERSELLGGIGVMMNREAS